MTLPVSRPPPGPQDLHIVRTSVINGLAPGVVPASITGVIANRGERDYYLTAVTVSISALAKAPTAVAGPCTAADYLLAKITMPVGRKLRPGARAGFAGAMIGFKDTSTNQDTCKGATVVLH